jgi:hypothetical protein
MIPLPPNPHTKKVIYPCPQVSDAILCPGMSKIVAASEQGRLFVFPAVVEANFDEDRIADEQGPML